MGILLALVTNGFSQFFFGFIAGHPTGKGFSNWSIVSVVFWAQFLPFVALLLCDFWVQRLGKLGPSFRIWRSTLYSVTGLVVFRQIHIAFFRTSIEWSTGTWMAAALVGGAGLFAFCFRFWTNIGSYLAWLGLLSPVLTVGFIVAAKREWSTPVAKQTDMPAFIVVFDALSLDALTRDGQIDREQFPNFSALAADSAWYRQATSNDLFTRASVHRLLSGFGESKTGDGKLAFLRIHEQRPVFISCIWPHIETEIAEKLGGRGQFQFRGLSDLIDRHPTPKTLGVLFETSFGRFQRKFLPSLEIHGVADDHGQSLLDLIDNAESPGRVVYWHGSLPHPPMVTDISGNFHRQAPENDRELFLKCYREQIQRADLLLGRFVAQLKKTGIYDRCLFIVTSDHGLQLDDESSTAPKPIGSWETRIPVFIRHPRLRPGTYDDQYQHMDFAPTVLDLLDIPFAAKDFEGSSVMAPLDPNRPRYCISQKGTIYLPDKQGLWHAQ